jgi:ATP synthase protein I
MVKIPSGAEKGRTPVMSDAVDEVIESNFKPMTAEEVRVWRLKNPSASPWRVLMLQVAVGLSMAVLTGLFSGQAHLAMSVGWGAVAVVIPSIVFVRALARQMHRKQPGSALGALMFWELVKVVLTVALLLAAPKVIADLSWLALVAGFVVTMKVYWLAMALGWMQPKSKPTIF